MADYYTNFSTLIKDLTSEECEWWRNYLIEREREKLKEPDNYWIVCELEPRDFDAWLYSEGSCDIEKTAELIQRFLSANRPNSCHSFEWADYCNKPRIDSFSGGGCFITAKKLQFFSPYKEIMKAQKKFEAKMKRNDRLWT
jgi:hypothetical protein